jgi:hypothetical protein
MKKVLVLATITIAFATAGTAAASNGGSASPNASCQGFLVSNATPDFSHVIQNDIRTTPGLIGPGIGSIVSDVASGPHEGNILACLGVDG